jgi:tetratricopeptide (TPR) repeat protein
MSRLLQATRWRFSAMFWTDPSESAIGPQNRGHWRCGSQAALLLASGIVTLAAIAVYCNSFRDVLVWDDVPSIQNNPTIRDLGRIGTVLSPPATGETVSGRPLLNLTLAVNYACGGTSVWGYHAVNLAIHIAAALILLGILRQTFLLPAVREYFGGAANFVALAITLLWTLHPLQTESVTYIVQRAQSLSSAFFLLTLYCAIRSAASSKPAAWYVAATLACLLGMATKEIVVTAPLVVLLYDRTFLAGSFGRALRQRWALYLGLAATWSLLAGLVVSTGLLTHRAEVDVPSPWIYACTQPGVILYYLRLCVSPHPLCLEYHWPLARTAGSILPAALAVGALLAATAWGLAVRRSWAFPLACFVLLLAPTSSIIPLRGAAAEHWLYLPLAPVLTLLVLAACAAGRAAVFRGVGRNRAATVLAGCLAIVAAIPLGILTFCRNADYSSEISIWEDTVAKAPHNELAHNNLGGAMATQGRLDEAIAEFRKAIELNPHYAMGHSNLGAALNRKGYSDEGIAQCRWALEIKPNDADAHYNLGIIYLDQGRLAEAIASFQEALRAKPDYASAHDDLANALFRQGKTDEAIAHYRQATEIMPRDALFQYNLACALARENNFAEAALHCRKALDIDPSNAAAHHNLGVILIRQGETAEALVHWREAIRREPQALDTLNKTAWTLATNKNPAIRRGDEAVALAERAARLPGGADPAVLDTLAAAYAEAGRFSEALNTANKALAVAESRGENALAKTIAQRIEIYRSGRPFRASR